MLKINKKQLDKFSKIFTHLIPVYKFNRKQQNLEQVSEKDWKAFIESNKTLTLQEMIDKNTYIENLSSPTFADIYQVPTDLNSIWKEAAKNNVLDNRLKELKEQALKEKEQAQFKLQELEKLHQHQSKENKEVK